MLLYLLRLSAVFVVKILVGAVHQLHVVVAAAAFAAVSAASAAAATVCAVAVVVDIDAAECKQVAVAQTFGSVPPCQMQKILLQRARGLFAVHAPSVVAEGAAAAERQMGELKPDPRCE